MKTLEVCPACGRATAESRCPGCGRVLEAEPAPGPKLSNAMARMSLLAALGALVPCLGLALGPAAVFLGWVGWKVGAHPQVGGRALAAAGMALGGLLFLAHVAWTGWMVMRWLR